MVLPVCSNGITDMFENNPWNFTEYSQNCHKQYGIYSELEKAIMMFGGRDITTATNIIFSNGLRDPWSAGGVLQSLSESLIAIQIPNACHHEDLRQSGPNDPPELKEARNQEISIIKTWINDYYNKINYYPLNLNFKNLSFNVNNHFD
jgi:lysosomal Pro-X carboxypeptidase